MASSPPPFSLQSELAQLPQAPGVYRMYNSRGDIIYVGKAKVLKNRVRSYFQKSSQLSPRIASMVEQIARFDTIITHTEVEALILECNLIKSLLPKYNILLRDDKRYPWIGISDDPYPRLFVTRNPITRGKTKYFGPYVSSGDMYRVLDLIKKNFPLRQRRKPLFKDRPCLNYSIGICPGPCQELISKAAYRKTVKQVELFLKGQTEELLKLVEEDMLAASEALRFEEAAKLRDRYRAVESVCQKQAVVFADERRNEDVLAMATDKTQGVFTLLSIRKGKLIRIQSQQLTIPKNTPDAEVYSAFLQQSYAQLQPDDLPQTLVVQFPLANLEDLDIFQAWAETQSGHALTLIEAQANTPHQELMEMALENARSTLRKALAYASHLDPAQGLMELQEALQLPDFPHRMECYDISHFQGKETVASMVVFIDGVPAKDQYRRFKIRSSEGEPNDFESMEEVISRRFQKNRNEDSDQDPDLVIIDGGKGQLSAALKGMAKAGVTDQAIISLAKRLEEVFIPGQKQAILLPPHSQGLYLLQQIRDEAHRFAITYHRSRRGKAALQSLFDELPRVGPKRKALLQEKYKTPQAMAKATAKEVAAVLGISPDHAAEMLTYLHKSLTP